MADNKTSPAREPWTIANTLTVLRIALIPAFVALMLLDWATPLFEDAAADVKPWVCVVVYALISLTDGIDGYLARSRNEVTVFGKFMDPIADKLLVVSALVVLVQFQTLPSWVPIVIVAREFLVSGLRMVVASAGTVVSASWIGKAKTAVTLVAICLFIVKDTSVFDGFQPGFDLFAWALMIVAVILTVWSMVDYFVTCWPVLTGRAAGMPPKKADTRQEGEGAFDPATLEGVHSLAADVVKLASAKGLRLATAESCTGGLVAAALTSVPGSSEVVCGGTVSYMESIKSKLLGVDPATIEREGVVSRQTALEMARGARSAYGADVAVSVTGVAGPGGGSELTPVGHVCFGISTELGDETEVVRFEGSRAQVRAQAVDRALLLMLAHMG